MAAPSRMNELGNRIEQIVTGNGKSFRSFALDAHIDPGMLHRVMHGKSHLSRKMARKLVEKYPELKDLLFDQLVTD